MCTTVVLFGAALGGSGLPESPGLSEDGPWWWPTQGEWLETQTLVPSDVDPEVHMFFGGRVAIDGDTLLASTQPDFWHDNWINCPGSGAPHHLPQFEDGCDWVYVFNRGDDGRWTETQKLIPSDAKTGDTFGWAIAVDEESGVIVVGNPGQKARTDTMYIFERQPDGLWQETARVNKTYSGIPDEQNSLFGLSVDVAGNTVVVTDSVNASTYVYEKIAGEWLQTHILPGGSGPYGVSVANDTLVNFIRWREPFECSENGMKRKHIQIWRRDNEGWKVEAIIDPQAEYGNRTQTTPNARVLNEEGDTLVLGAAGDRRLYGLHTEHCVILDAPEPIGEAQIHTSGGAMGAVGAAWIYERINGKWVQTADIPNPMPDVGPVTGGSVFGGAVDISGDLVVVGSWGMYNAGVRSGAAYVYEKVAGDWILQAKLRNHNAGELNYFGYSVGVSGTTVVAGADLSSYTGTAHTYEPLVGPLSDLPEV